MTIEMEGGVITKVSKSRKAPKTAKPEPAAESTPATPKPKTRKLALVKDPPAPATDAQAIGPAPEPEKPVLRPPAKPKRKPRTIAAEAASAAEHAQSLGGLADAFTGKLVADGKTPGTVASYRNELNLALAHFGSATRVTELTKEAVLEYFLSRPVMKLRSGRSKSQLSIDKTRRVWRQALTWALQQGWLKESIVPELPPAS